MNYYLLIEPVWNRNANTRVEAVNVTPSFNRTSLESKRKRGYTLDQICELLIEPVWNRNIILRSSLLWEVSLLIEPVWNRNFIRVIVIDNQSFPFNRTSLESKLLFGRFNVIH